MFCPGFCFYKNGHSTLNVRKKMRGLRVQQSAIEIIVNWTFSYFYIYNEKSGSFSGKLSNNDKRV